MISSSSFLDITCVVRVTYFITNFFRIHFGTDDSKVRLTTLVLVFALFIELDDSILFHLELSLCSRWWSTDYWDI